jgi:solute carrier family 25 folate transporter 32
MFPQAQATSTNSAERYTNTWIAFRSIYQTEGWRAFYKGLAPSLIGVTHVAVHFPLYEKMKAWAGESRSRWLKMIGNGMLILVLTSLATEDGAPLSSKRILVCSALSKMVASVITYPHEVLRTRLQIQKRQRADKVAQIQKTTGASTAALEQGKQGLVDTIKSIAARDGWKGFYRGISINLVRTVPSSAVTMLT